MIIYTFSTQKKLPQTQLFPGVVYTSQQADPLSDNSP